MIGVIFPNLEAVDLVAFGALRVSFSCPWCESTAHLLGGNRHDS
jgi:hypothetical protein